MTFAAGLTRPGVERPLPAKTLYAQVVAAAVLVVIAVAVFGALTSRDAAERQAVDVVCRGP